LIVDVLYTNILSSITVAIIIEPIKKINSSKNLRLTVMTFIHRILNELKYLTPCALYAYS